jgi:hypothetical protein
MGFADLAPKPNHVRSERCAWRIEYIPSYGSAVHATRHLVSAVRGRVGSNTLRLACVSQRWARGDHDFFVLIVVCRGYHIPAL